MEVANFQPPAAQPEAPADASMDIDMDVDLGVPEPEPIELVSDAIFGYCKGAANSRRSRTPRHPQPTGRSIPRVPKSSMRRSISEESTS